MRLRTFAAGLLWLCAATAGAQQEHVTFLVIGKHASYEQAPPSPPEPVDFSFFSEIFLTPNGDASDATLAVPGGSPVAFEDRRAAPDGRRDNLLSVTGRSRYSSFGALQQDYPDGHYVVAFDTPTGSVSAALEFQERPLPQAPVVQIRQAGRACDELLPGVDATVSWERFAHGRDDPNGILDDLVFVILEDADGRRVAHSGRPFGSETYLTHRAEHFVVDGAVLEAGERYTLSVEHALLDDTTQFDGIPAFTTRAVTTRVAVTVAESAEQACLAPESTLASQVTMFYYDDLAAATEFYAEDLGLRSTLDWDWVRFFATGPASEVGLVRRGDGAWHDPQPDNAVMLSIVTTDVDAWYRRIAGNERVRVLKPIASGGGIRSFLLEDPGGYTVEFFEWLERPGQ